MEVTLGSLFDGIGGFPLVAKRNGIKPIWASEIEKLCRLITEKRFPNMLQLGDITDLDGSKLDPVDIIAMGSPCQDLSIAGKQVGLKGERSGLFFEAIRIAKEMRESTNGESPRFIVWENVEGALNSNRGYDFRVVLEEIAKTAIPMPNSGRWGAAGMVRSDKCEVAWRVLNAQYFGVPQRRKRIFLIADYGKGERCASKVLFESQVLRGDFKESVQKEVISTANIKRSVEKTSNIGKVNLYDVNYLGIGGAREYNQDISPCVLKEYGSGGGHVPLVCYCISGNIIDREEKNGGNHLGIKEDISFTLDTKNTHAVYKNSDVVNTLCASDYKGVGNQYVKANKCVIDAKTDRVRRLTPLECERLQGFPDNWTKINHKFCVDSARYRAIGNSMALPCVDFVISRIMKYGFSKAQ